MRRFAAVLLSVCFAIVLAPSAHAGEFTVFGPQNFVRDKGKPLPESHVFTIPDAPTEYSLRIFNGGAQNEFERVSSAGVWLNGVEVVGPNQFNQRVSEIEVPVTPSKENRLVVELRSATGSAFTLEVVGVDNAPPLVSDLIPSNGDTLPDPEVNLTGLVSDPLSGVATVTCHTNNTTEEALVNREEPDDGSFIFACSLPLVVGPNAVTVQATDNAGNTASSFLTIHHVLPPNVTIDSPSDLQFFFKSPDTVTGKVDDLGAKVSVDGTAASVANGVFTAPVNLASGFHTITAVAQNVAGSNSDSVRVFVVIGSAPTVAITSPKAGFVLGGVETQNIIIPVNVIVEGWVRDNRLLPSGQPAVTVSFNNSPKTATVSQGPSGACLSSNRCWKYSAKTSFSPPNGTNLSIKVEAQTGGGTASRQVSGIVDFCVECVGSGCVTKGACGASLFQRPGCRQSRRCITKADGCSAPLLFKDPDNPVGGRLGLSSTEFGIDEDGLVAGAPTVFGQPRPLQLPCNRHDECYHQRCPQQQTRLGVFEDKQDCNGRFYEDLKAVCKRAYPESVCPVDRIGLLNCPAWRAEKFSCYNWARRYLNAVAADTFRYLLLSTYDGTWPYDNKNGVKLLTPCEGCPPIE